MSTFSTKFEFIMCLCLYSRATVSIHLQDTDPIQLQKMMYVDADAPASQSLWSRRFGRSFMKAFLIACSLVLELEIRFVWHVTDFNLAKGLLCRKLVSPLGSVRLWRDNDAVELRGHNVVI